MLLPMKQTQPSPYIHLFYTAIRWNASLYIFYKISSTILSFCIFHTLTTKDFSTWANTQALIYLALLWLDLGFRKSLPWFIPSIAHTHYLYTFIQQILIFQLLLLTSTPLLCLGITALLPAALHYHVTHYLHTIFYNNLLLGLFFVLFITEGLLALIRILFHAQFLNKSFTLLSSLFLTIELILAGCILLSGADSYYMLIQLLTAKFLCSTTLVIVSVTMLYTHRKKEPVIKEQIIMHPIRQAPAFIKHTAIIWMYTNLKSITERNFLLPLFTMTLGAEAANMFKIAQDGALLFERSILKTIGSSDTALLASIQEGESAQDNAFRKLTTKIATLCIPLFGILSFLIVQYHGTSINRMMFHIFLILTVTYLLEVLLSPYERILEVRQRYGLLLLAYIPYILGTLFLFMRVSLIGLFNFILIMQGVRLVSSLCMVAFARRHFGLSMEWRPLISLGVAACVGGLVSSYVLQWALGSSGHAGFVLTLFNK